MFPFYTTVCSMQTAFMENTGNMYWTTIGLSATVIASLIARIITVSCLANKASFRRTVYYTKMEDV